LRASAKQSQGYENKSVVIFTFYRRSGNKRLSAFGGSARGMTSVADAPRNDKSKLVNKSYVIWILDFLPVGRQGFGTI